MIIFSGFPLLHPKKDYETMDDDWGYPHDYGNLQATGR